MGTVEQLNSDQDMEVLRDLYVDSSAWRRTLNHEAPWSYERLIELLDEEFHFSRENFERFTQEVKDGTRCLSCGHILGELMDDGYELVCYLCGGRFHE